jgi:ankyrin repeat protein
MGNAAEHQIGTPIDNNLIALLLTGQTERVIDKIESDSSGAFLRDSINFRNDNLLHYACAKNNLALVQYLVKRNPKLTTLSNNQDQLPADLATDPAVKTLC